MIRNKRTLAAILGIAAMATGLSGCQRTGMAEPETYGSVSAVALAEYPKEPVYKNDLERYENRKEIPENFLTAYQDFFMETGSALFKDSRENIIYSPLSFYYALAFAAGGAFGNTKKELLHILHYEDAEELSADCRTAFEALYHVPNKKNGKDRDSGEYPPESRYSFTMASSLWADKSLEVKKEFADYGAAYFYGDTYSADFGAPETGMAMAEWVKERTGGILEPSAAIPEDLVLSLKNTVYFYDEWLDKFEKENTREDSFKKADGESVVCDFMNRTMGSHGFRKGKNFTMSSLPLKNGTVEFYLPDEGVDVHGFFEDPNTLYGVIEGEDGAGMGEVVWKIPKFSYGSSLELTALLKNLGVETAFREDADFTGISDSSPLFFTTVTQDAHIGVDENGVEAAAYTEIAWAGATMPVGRADMILDRPFFYVIRNRGQVVFIGICEDPKG